MPTTAQPVRIGQVDEIEVLHADGRRGLTRLKVVGVAGGTLQSALVGKALAAQQSHHSASAAVDAEVSNPAGEFGDDAE